MFDSVAAITGQRLLLWNGVLPYGQKKNILRLKKIFEIRPAAEHAERSAVNRQTPENLEAVYRRLKPALEEKARRDREEEAGRTILYPDGVLMI